MGSNSDHIFSSKIRCLRYVYDWFVFNGFSYSDLAKLIYAAVNNMKKTIQVVLLIISAIVLSGCMYPDEMKVENQIPGQDQIDSVQRALNEFKEDTGVLPIKNRDMDTDIFIKYIIDFEKLVPKYLSSAPSNAYEKGGIFQYVIWDAEKNPTVKLVDLRVPDKIRDVNARMKVKEYPQYGKQISDYVYAINHENIGYKEPLTVASPYSNNLLPLVLTTEGKVYVDYTIDLNLFIQEQNLTLTEGEDIRTYLAQYYPVLPAYSLPYTVNEDNEPIFMFNPLN